MPHDGERGNPEAQPGEGAGWVGLGRSIRATWHTLKVLRAPLLVLVAGAVVFLGLDQGHDLLHELGRPRPWGFREDSRVAAFFVAMIGWATATWYFARVRLYLPHGVDRRVATWVPRLMGSATFVIVGGGFVLAARHHHDVMGGADGQGLRWSMWLLAGGFLVGAVIFLAIVRRRRGRDGDTWRQPPVATPDHPVRYQPVTWRVVGGAVALSVLLVAAVAAAPLWFGGHSGALAVVVTALALAVAFGSTLAALSDHLRVPFGLLALLLLVIISLTGNPHPVRTLSGEAAPRERIAEDFPKWFEARLAERGASSTAPVPVFVVHAEGGGIRAAYWTASALARLQDDNPSFGRHVYAISGVSGGSLGGLLFAGMLADGERLQPEGCGPTGRHVCLAKRVLGEDFVSPLLAALLFPDVARLFVPWLWGPDRAAALELGWERAWFQHAGSDRLAKPFLALWQGDELRERPSLFLNATSAERGSRVVLSNLRLDPRFFCDVEDGLVVLQAPVSASVAAHLSARFPYVSPPGKVWEGGEARHLVDGGYFENSGAATAADVLASVRKVVEQRGWQHRFYPVVLSLQNSRRSTSASGGIIRLLTEVTGPPVALFNTRAARGELARVSLFRDLLESEEAPGRHRALRTQRGAHIDISLSDDTADVPLGWALSAASMKVMDGQVAGNAAGFAMVKSLLSAPP